MKNASFTCQENGSNKEYHIQMVESGSGFVINFQYGAIGSTLKPGTKTPGPVSEAEAEKLFAKLVKERLSKGYIQTGDAQASKFSADVVIEKKTHGIFPQLLNAIDEEDVDKYINDDDYLMQEKKDGERRMVKSINPSTESQTFIGLNKKGQEVNLQDFIINAFFEAYDNQSDGEYSLEECVLDGEILSDKLIVFDILSIHDKDLKNVSCVERLKILNRLVFNSDAGKIQIAETAFTREEKRKMYNELKAANAEGVVFKLKSAKYTAGRPNSGGSQFKLKFYKEASFIVKDFTKGKRSVGLELIDEKGQRVHIGKCTIPPNKDLPSIGDVVEVRYLYCYRGGCIFQPFYKDKRNDVDVEECLMSQLKYKQGQESEEENED